VQPESLLVVETAELPRTAAEHVARILTVAVSERGRASVALSGGSTPRAMHEALAQVSDVPWDRIDVYFGDERCVPPEHPDSNYRMAKESLFDRVPLPSHSIHRPEAERPDRDAAARAYEAILPSAIDLVVLGIGEDGHTASLFPGAASLNEKVRGYIAVTGPKPPPDRLTLTPAALAAARTLMTLASGAGKAEPVARALRGAWDPLNTPSQLARRGLWIVDTAAAAQFGHGGAHR